MPKGDLQRQYSSCCEVAAQAQSFTVIESSIKPLSTFILTAPWAVCHCLKQWQYFNKIFDFENNNQNIFKDIAPHFLVYLCLCIWDKSFSIVCICAVLYFTQNCALGTVCPAITLFTFVDSSVCFFSFCFSSHWVVTYMYQPLILCRLLALEVVILLCEMSIF